jgi:D-amino-acid oxidase
VKVRVLGAGIVGLSCALRLAEAGHSVEIMAAQPPQQTTSAVAAALWYPYRAYPQGPVTRWSARGLEVFTGMLSDPTSGVQLRSGCELFREPAPDPWWIEAAPSLRRLSGQALPDGYRDGYELTVPVIDMSVHLAWLLGRVQALGVVCVWRRVETLHEAAFATDVVVNCAGMGARQVAADDSLVAVRGQIVVVEQFGLSRWFLDQNDGPLPTYIVPRLASVVLGGSADAQDEDLAVRPELTTDIVRRCAALVPGVASARVLAHKVGLRPGRPEVRLEAEEFGDGQLVVHCYGHGGAGVTLSYGCADDVVAALK